MFPKSSAADAAPAGFPSVLSSAEPESRISLSEVLSSLSHALDLTEGQPLGHTLRSCAIGMRLAESLGLGAEQRSALYYALLLKDAGCSSNAARMASLFGSADQAVKYRMKLVDWHQGLPLAIRTVRLTGLGKSLASRVRHFVGVAKTEDLTRQLIQIRCDRGAEIVLQLGFPEATADAVRCLDEHWCGKGYPEGKRGDEIPLLARIANLAQCVEVFHHAHGREAALRMARARRGTWFDPELVDLLLRWGTDTSWWERLEGEDVTGLVVAAEPADLARMATNADLDSVAQAFADIIDAKSPYTFRHSRNVAGYALWIGRQMGVDPAAERRLYRAGLLHDIGKLGISSEILDKNGPLTADERAEIERHPMYSWEILSRVSAFEEFAWTAVLHHEKLDGSGYPWGVSGTDIDQEARILCVADIYEALTADRPYRAGLPPAVALDIIRKDAGTRLCPEVVDALEVAVAEPESAL